MKELRWYGNFNNLFNLLFEKEDFWDFQQIFKGRKKTLKILCILKLGALFLEEKLSHQYYSPSKHLSLTLEGFISLIVL